jgi:hypothetical protein
VFCPKCGDEFRPGFTHCPDCDVDLVEALPSPEVEDPGPLEMVTVLETGDQSLVAIAKSVLEGAGIPCIARNERLQNLFGWGTIGTGFNAAMGPIRVQVLKEDADAARELLAARPMAAPDDDDA